jgi:hypothetical protein
MDFEPLSDAEKVLVGQGHAGDKAMRLRPFFLLVLLFALACSGFAQVDHALTKNKTDAPLQITDASCVKFQEVWDCHATIQFAATKETWNGYGLLWTVTYDDGTKSVVRSTGDRGLPPPPGEKRKSSFEPGEILVGRNRSVGFGTKNRDGKTLRLTDAEVEVEFVVNTNGTVWGDSKSPSYLRMLANRKAANEGSQPVPPLS